METPVGNLRAGSTGLRSIRRNVTVTLTGATGSICRPRFGASSVVEETAQLSAAAWVLQFAERLRLDLTDALARNIELLADLLKRVIGVHTYPESHSQHPLFTRRQTGEHTRGRLPQIGL